jgi:signal transduction histidine kinase
MQDNYFLIAVQDTGTGIPDDIKPKIFESFYTTKPKGEGTGLGLSIVKNIVIEHGGDLLVDSEMGKGSTFTIKLPALKLSPLNKTDKIQAA